MLLLSRNSGWRASNPGVLQDWVWEAGETANETCPVGSLRTVSAVNSCHQGRIPLYSVGVESAQQVQKAVRFARRHNLRLVIRNTGHDLAGRSSAPDSFQIHTHRLQEIHFHTNLRLNGSNASLGPAVTVGAGVMMGNLYSQAARNGYMVLGGDCPTVGVVGGFLQGGGVSDFLSLNQGLGVDNVLEYEVVTADGEIVVANALQNQDLFWALRGGGGGTFGVVTRATMRVFPDVPVVISEILLEASKSNSSSWTQGLSVVLTALQSLNRENVGGQLVIVVLPKLAVQASIKFFFLDATETAAIDHRMKSFLTELSRANVKYAYSSKGLPHFSSNYRQVPDIHADNDYGVLGSTVAISQQLFDSPQGPEKVANALANLPMSPGDLLFTSNLGGRVILNGGLAETSMHPAWRAASQLLNYVHTVEPSIEGRAKAREKLTNIQMPMLYAIDPKFKLSYRNVGDPNEKNFQQVYWGSNYGRLSDIKKKWDTTDLFFSKLGIGSEKWDSEGMCRKHQEAFYQKMRRFISLTTFTLKN
ncbi:oxidoreductase [Nannizzia gypsea CBS 118893]|uniref:Oxidoreductase n=1 Tax=Arthroderma gypseum (strain ATCC MYA-4604 / CBS 118893) TaxID=535722 RepID=E4UZX0_ARTGP|nr:oxidoreductase [Nannizzia gypsea CBS 118893]EFR02907.1 oxidoreductase [Nannizzia gypsea CBS 118893]